MARDPRISDIFYYFEQHTNISSGRTVGRKIGVVQEILCKKLLLQSATIRDCIIYEPKMPGISGATHKVEFVLLQPVNAIELSIGASYSPSPGFSIKAGTADPYAKSAKLQLTVGTKKTNTTVLEGRVIKVPDTALHIKIMDIDAKRIRMTVLDDSSPVASIESKRVGAQRFSGSDKLGSGIQTIEKAKQASLVAIDFDLKYNKKLLVQNPAKTGRSFRSFVVLGNGVHWTNHDLAVLETYVDYTYLATDAAVIRYADFVRVLADNQKADFFKFFMAYFNGMTKTPLPSFVHANVPVIPSLV